MGKRHFLRTIVLLTLANVAWADDAMRCIGLVAEGQLDAARPVCRNLELSDPNNAVALGFYQVYAEIGAERMRQLSVRGIDEATPAEIRTLQSARRNYLVGAEAGFAEAQMLLATLIHLLEPPEITIDGIVRSEEHLRWLTEAARQDVPEANYQLGMWAIGGSGSILERPELLHYLERAAQLGHVEAAALLSEYEKVSRVVATENLDDPESLRKYAASLWRGPQSDEQEANRLMRKLADAGDEEAMITAGKWAWPKDPDGAFTYLSMAAKLNNAEAMTALGNYYACRGDSGEAVRWFAEARDRGDAVARYSLKELGEWGIEEWSCGYL